MALDVISTPISPQVVVQFLDKLDQRGEVYSFQAHILTPNALSLELYRDGADDPLQLMLTGDGKWTAKHVLVVGEQD